MALDEKMLHKKEEEKPREKEKEKPESGRPKVRNVLEKDSIQYNCQDLDQEQNVDVNPNQTNTQCVHISISSDKVNLSSKITGTTYYEANKEVVPNTKIHLFSALKVHYRYIKPILMVTEILLLIYHRATIP